MEIHNILAQEVAHKLKLAGAQYKIILQDGTEFGDLKVVPVKLRTRTQTVPTGTYKNVYQPLIDPMQVGDVIELDYKKHSVEPQPLAGAAQSYMCQKFGNGSTKAHWNKKTERIEILRMK